MELVVFLFHHDEASAEAARELAAEQPRVLRPVRLPATPFFESAFFRRPSFLAAMRDAGDAPWVGFLAYSYPKKLRRRPADWAAVLEAALRRTPDADVLALLPGSANMYLHAETFHPGFMRVWALLLQRMGVSGEALRTPTPLGFYCNYWLARRELADAYSIFATRAMTVMETDAELAALLDADANYVFTAERLDAERLQRICGKPYYTFHAFIMERLPCLFFQMRGARVVTP